MMVIHQKISSGGELVAHSDLRVSTGSRRAIDKELLVLHLEHWKGRIWKASK